MRPGLTGNCLQVMHTHLFFLGTFALTFFACFSQLRLVIIPTQSHTLYLQLLLHMDTWDAHDSETRQKLCVAECLDCGSKLSR